MLARLQNYVAFAVAMLRHEELRQDRRAVTVAKAFQQLARYYDLTTRDLTEVRATSALCAEFTRALLGTPAQVRLFSARPEVLYEVFGWLRLTENAAIECALKVPQREEVECKRRLVKAGLALAEDHSLARQSVGILLLTLVAVSALLFGAADAEADEVAELLDASRDAEPGSPRGLALLAAEAIRSELFAPDAGAGAAVTDQAAA